MNTTKIAFAFESYGRTLNRRNSFFVGSLSVLPGNGHRKLLIRSPSERNFFQRQPIRSCFPLRITFTQNLEDLNILDICWREIGSPFLIASPSKRSFHCRKITIPFVQVYSDLLENFFHILDISEKYNMEMEGLWTNPGIWVFPKCFHWICSMQWLKHLSLQ